MYIRRAKEEDVGRINDLLRQVLEVHAKGRPDIFIGGTKKYTDPELIDLIHDDSRPIFVWLDEENVVQGYCFCVHEETRGIQNMHDMKTLYIDDLCVDENGRGKHVGTELFEYVKEYARKTGCYRITLNVWELNESARGFYEKCGLLPLKTTMEQIL